jgi:phage terminase small subunit
MLTHKQTIFVYEYLKTGNATASYKYAYTTDNDNEAAVNSSRLLRNTKIVEEINKFKKTMAEKTVITIEQCVAKIVALSETAQKDSDKLRACDMLMKHLGGYVTIGEIIDRMTNDQAAELTEKILARIKPDK